MIFAGFGEDFDKAPGGEVLELVDVEVEVAAVFFCLVDAVHGGKLDFGDEHGAKEGGVVFAKLALGEVGQENFALVHDFPNGEAVGGGVGDAPDEGGRDKLADFVEDRRDGLGPKLVAHGLKLPGPKVLKDGVGQL